MISVASHLSCVFFPCILYSSISLILCYLYAEEFATFLNYARALRFEDKPDYSYLRKLFASIVQCENIVFDYVFDWTVVKQEMDGRRNGRSQQGAAAEGEAPREAGAPRQRSRQAAPAANDSAQPAAPPRERRK